MIWLAVFAGTLLVQYLLLLIFLKTNWRNHSKKIESLPKVSVLVAARNEEQDLPLLLASLDRLDYPVEKLQILLANDGSTDQTQAIIQDWVDQGANRQVLHTSPARNENLKKNGKAWALELLSAEATGDFFFMTDADCEVPATWIREGITCWEGGIGLVLGITQVKSVSLWERMQELDWWHTLGIVKVVTDLGLPTTGLGNNMVISREAYLKCGGFAALPFSMTEDLEISKAICNAGYKIRHQVSAHFLVKTKAEKGLQALLRQRKRWMAGAMTLSIPWKILLSLQVLFFPVILGLIWLDGSLGLGILGVKVLAQSLFLYFFAQKASQRLSLMDLLVFEFYQFWNLSLTILYYFWPGPQVWKARNYP